MPKGEFTHAAADLRPQPYLVLTGCDPTLPHPQKVRRGWVWRADKVALLIFPGRIPSDTITNMRSDREELSVVFIGNNYVR